MKKIKILTIILAIVLISVIAFFGIYIKVQNRMENKIKDYSYNMDLKGSRIITYSVKNSNKTIVKDSEGKEVDNASNLTDEELAEKGYVKEEVPYNTEENLTEENYKKAKKIIETRLKKLEIEEYNIRLNKENGDITIEVPEDERTDSIVSNIATVGKFQILDTETKEILMTNDDIKDVKVMYGSNGTSSQNGTSAYMDIDFTKDGKKKIEEISTNYKKVEKSDSEENTSEETASDETVNEENNESEQEQEKTVTMKIDDEVIMTSGFEEVNHIGKMQLTVGSATTDAKTLQSNIRQATSMANILRTGNMPVAYDVSKNEYVISDVETNTLNIIMYVVAGIALVGVIIFIIRYKVVGLLAGISYIGFAGLFLLIIRYANVILSVEGIVGIIIALALNYIFVNLLLKNIKDNKAKQAIKETYKEFFTKILPVCIMVVAFCFVKWMPISSFGMTMFWGIALIAIYNIIVTNLLVRINESK